MEPLQICIPITKMNDKLTWSTVSSVKNKCSWFEHKLSCKSVVMVTSEKIGGLFRLQVFIFLCSYSNYTRVLCALVWILFLHLRRRGLQFHPSIVQVEFKAKILINYLGPQTATWHWCFIFLLYVYNGKCCCSLVPKEIPCFHTNLCGNW